MYKLDQSRLNEFIQGLCRGREVFAFEQARPIDSAQQAEEQYHLVRTDEWQMDKHTLGEYRPIEPLKSLVFPPREFLGSLAGPSEAPAIKERIVVGIKNCDLSALKIYDYVFQKSEPVDPFYAEAREKTFLVSCDCTDARDVCFCSAVDQQPYAKEGFDINISPTSKGCVIEAGSERGEKLLKNVEQVLEPADESIIQERDKNRAELTQRVRDQAAEKGLQPGTDLKQAIQKTLESGLWDEFAKDCVECGACNFVCCTCHCFLLADGTSKNKTPARVKQWDSCLYRNFARVAGGANPRNHRAERLYNRFDKKFNFFHEVLGTYACEGCGRCVEACTGKIDIREVLRRAVESAECGMRNAELGMRRRKRAVENAECRVRNGVANEFG